MHILSPGVHMKRRFFSNFLFKAEQTLGKAIILFAIIVFPYANIVLEGSGIKGVGILLGCGIFLALCVVLVAKKFNLNRLSLFTPQILIVIGVSLRITACFILPFDPKADAFENVFLAKRLASGLSFQSEHGLYAYLPPGYPLYLTPFFLLFDKASLAVHIANTILFCIGALAIFRLSEVVNHRGSAMAGLALFCFWPNHIFLSALALKENLAICAMLMAMWSFYTATSSLKSTARLLNFSILGGLSLGIAALSQPSLMLIGLLLPFAFIDKLLTNKQSALKIIATAGITFFLAIAPWKVRNYIVFEGKFSGITATGGDVFYRANNELANGSWTPRGKVALDGVNELEADKHGWQLGREWIFAHPADALKLSLRKLVHLFKWDTYGAYWSILRTNGKDESEAYTFLSQNKVQDWLYRISTWLSNTFWLIVLALAYIGMCRGQIGKKIISAPLLYPLFYTTAVHCIFESGDRHHMVPFALLIILAAKNADDENCSKTQKFNWHFGKLERMFSSKDITVSNSKNNFAK